MNLKQIIWKMLFIISKTLQFNILQNFKMKYYPTFGKYR